jgi:hypothetical protein
VILHQGARAHTIDYNPIISRSDRVKTWTVAEWDAAPRLFDAALSISSFEHDGLGCYGDPLDPDGDLKAMRKLKGIVKPGAIVLLAVPIGADQVIFNEARVYGRVRLPMLLEGWEQVDSFGFDFVPDLIDSNGSVQPVLVLRNR